MKIEPSVTLSVAVLALAAAVSGEMNVHLEPLRPLLGRTWRGSLPGGSSEKPVVDVSRYELALSGQAVRVRHSVNDGDYAGESFIVWDQGKRSLVYFYFTTAGFYTTGTFRADDGGALVSEETVVGAAGGITAVRGTHRLLADGHLHVKTEYLKNGRWVDGRDTDYVEDPSAVVRLKEDAPSGLPK